MKSAFREIETLFRVASVEELYPALFSDVGHFKTTTELKDFVDESIFSIFPDSVREVPASTL
jgi:hypothetical protein